MGKRRDRRRERKRGSLLKEGAACRRRSTTLDNISSRRDFTRTGQGNRRQSSASEGGVGGALRLRDVAGAERAQRGHRGADARIPVCGGALDRGQPVGGF